MNENELREKTEIGEVSMRSLAPGDRVQMSEQGLAKHPKYGDLKGFIVRRGSPSSWRTKFDGRTSIQTIHQDYLQRVEG